MHNINKLHIYQLARRLFTRRIHFTSWGSASRLYPHYAHSVLLKTLHVFAEGSTALSGKCSAFSGAQRKTKSENNEFASFGRSCSDCDV